MALKLCDRMGQIYNKFVFYWTKYFMKEGCFVLCKFHEEVDNALTRCDCQDMNGKMIGILGPDKCEASRSNDTDGSYRSNVNDLSLTKL